mmetsp:Transcript_112883/g.268938  ORF Transcript_112883/g.268938 Transcript_112883/m.268938 type:complete len:148 (-) Transcript_112883:489-932(-)
MRQNRKELLSPWRFHLRVSPDNQKAPTLKGVRSSSHPAFSSFLASKEIIEGPCKEVQTAHSPDVNENPSSVLTLPKSKDNHCGAGPADVQAARLEPSMRTAQPKSAVAALEELQLAVQAAPPWQAQIEVPQARDLAGGSPVVQRLSL